MEYAEGSIPVLVRLLRQEPEEPALCHATRAIANLTVSSERISEVVKLGGVKLLVEVALTSNTASRLNAVTAIGNIAQEPDGRDAAFAEGADGALTTVLEDCPTKSQLAAEAVRAIANLTTGGVVGAQRSDAEAANLPAGPGTPPRTPQQLGSPRRADLLSPLFSLSRETARSRSARLASPRRGSPLRRSTGAVFPLRLDSPLTRRRGSPGPRSPSPPTARRSSPASRRLSSSLPTEASLRAFHPAPWIPPGRAPSRPSSASMSPATRPRASPTRSARRGQSPSWGPAPPPAAREPLLGSIRRARDRLDASPLRRGGDTGLRAGVDEGKEEGPPGEYVSVPELVAWIGRGIAPGRGWEAAIWAAGSLANRPMTDEEKDQCRRVGGISALLELLQAGAEARRVACAALSRVLHNHPRNCEAARQVGGLEQLAAILKQERRDDDSLSWVTCALSQLTFRSIEDCRALVAAGAVPSLLAIVGGADGDEEARANALRILCNLAHLPEACTAIRHGDGLRLLVGMLGRSGREREEEAAVVARALLNVACNDPDEGAVRRAGGIEPLLRLLEKPKSEAAAVALLALSQLAARGDDNCRAIHGCGGLDRLMRLLRSGPGEEATQAALGALLNLTGSPTVCEGVFQAGTIPQLVRMLDEPEMTAAVRLQVARIMSNLLQNKDNANMIRIAGGIKPLVRALADSAPGGEAAQVAAVALSQLASGNAANKDAIREAGGIPPLVGLLGSRDGDAARWAACALAEIAEESLSNCSAVRFAGGVDRLIDLLRDGAPSQVATQAVRAIASLSLGRENQDIVRRRGGIPLVLALLDEEWGHSARVVAACAAAELASGNRLNCEAIVRDGGLDRLLGVLVAKPSDTVIGHIMQAVAEIVEFCPEARSTILNHAEAEAAIRDFGAEGSSYDSNGRQAIRILSCIDAPTKDYQRRTDTDCAQGSLNQTASGAPDNCCAGCSCSKSDEKLQGSWKQSSRSNAAEWTRHGSESSRYMFTCACSKPTLQPYTGSWSPR